jgi:hypothetical protein
MHWELQGLGTVWPALDVRMLVPGPSVWTGSTAPADAQREAGSGKREVGVAQTVYLRDFYSVSVLW